MMKEKKTLPSRPVRRMNRETEHVRRNERKALKTEGLVFSLSLDFIFQLTLMLEVEERKRIFPFQSIGCNEILCDYVLTH